MAECGSQCDLLRATGTPCNSHTPKRVYTFIAAGL